MIRWPGSIVSDDCFLDDGNIKTAPDFILENLEEIFQYEVLNANLSALVADPGLVALDLLPGSSEK